MNFFKKLFSNKKFGTNSEDTLAEVKELYTEEYFNKRYQEDVIEEHIMDGTRKMIESYFVANKITPVESPINHPKNLDLTVDEGFGFALFCKASNFDESMPPSLLAMAFNDYLIKNYGFKLYKDSEPEYPLRGMTLKYDKNGAKLSLYPIEYAVKVLAYEASFEDLYSRINDNLLRMPDINDVLKG